MWTSERRAAVRGQPASELRVAIRPGLTAVVANLSSDGALVESFHPLRPGSTVYLVLDGTPRLFRAASVLRCHVRSLTPTAVVFTAALRFTEPLPGGVMGSACPGRSGPADP